MENKLMNVGQNSIMDNSVKTDETEVLFIAV